MKWRAPDNNQNEEIVDTPNLFFKRADLPEQLQEKVWEHQINLQAHGIDPNIEPETAVLGPGYIQLGALPLSLRKEVLKELY